MIVKFSEFLPKLHVIRALCCIAGKTSFVVEISMCWLEETRNIGHNKVVFAHNRGCYPKMIDCWIKTHYHGNLEGRKMIN